MSEMIERIARAQKIALLEATGGTLPDNLFEIMANAGVRAMREPTEAQYEALCATDKMWRELSSREVWQTYIDAALSDVSRETEKGEPHVR